MLRHGMTSKILHDEGGESKKLSDFCWVKKKGTIPYHSKTIGKEERINQTIILMLRTLVDLHKNKWKNLVKKLVFEYNCTKYYTSRHLPFYHVTSSLADSSNLQ